MITLQEYIENLVQEDDSGIANTTSGVATHPTPLGDKKKPVKRKDDSEE